MSKPVKTINGIELPTWTDPTSIAAYLTTLVTAVVGVITLTHPGFTEPSVVPSLIPAVSLVVAGAAQLLNISRHFLVRALAILSGYTVDKPSS